MSHTCPRRVETGMDRPDSPFRHSGRDLDKYADRDGDGISACSWCGSLSPELALSMIATGHRVIPTDKPYKVYIADVERQPGADPSRLRVVSSTNQPREGYRGWKDLSKDERAIVRGDGGRYRREKDWYYQFESQGPTVSQVKFYPAHWSESQGNEFLSLYRAGRVNIGVPGHFYSGIAVPHTVSGCHGECRVHRGAEL